MLPAACCFAVDAGKAENRVIGEETVEKNRQQRGTAHVVDVVL